MHDFTGNAHTSGVSCQIAGHIAPFLLGDYRCYDAATQIVSKHRRGHSLANSLEIPMSIAILRRYTKRMLETSVSVWVTANLRELSNEKYTIQKQLHTMGPKYAKYEGSNGSWSSAFVKCARESIRK